MSNVPLESTTHAILQHHLPLITPRVEFDFARLNPSAPVTARLDFDFLPEEGRASLFDPNDKGKKVRSHAMSCAACIHSDIHSPESHCLIRHELRLCIDLRRL